MLYCLLQKLWNSYGRVRVVLTSWYFYLCHQFWHIRREKKSSAECRDTSNASALEFLSAISLSAVTPKLVCSSQNRMSQHNDAHWQEFSFAAVSKPCIIKQNKITETKILHFFVCFSDETKENMVFEKIMMNICCQ